MNFNVIDPWTRFLALIFGMEKNCTVYISLGMLFLFDLKRFVVWLDFGVRPLVGLDHC
jgi:hypothetical protein